jgi:Ca2+-binding RTX toxin-like protein
VENLVLGAGVIQGVGNALANTIEGNAEDNLLEGAGGNDLLSGGLGADEMQGGAGNDTYVVDDAGDSVVELDGQGYDTVASGIDIGLAEHVEKAVLTGSADTDATGNELDNELVGNAGGNALDGAGGADAMAGGLGDDTYHTDDLGDTITENASEGVDTEIRHHDSDYLLSANVENLTLTGTVYRGNGNELDNTITGNDADNNLWGRQGDDRLLGNDGADQLIGDTGGDYLDGGDGDDLMDGGDGDDTLLGGLGDDQLDGGGGSNTLRGGSGDDIYVYGADGGVCEIDNSDGGTDWLLFTDDLTLDELEFTQVDNDLVITVEDSAGKITVTNWFLGAEYQIDYIQPDGGNGIPAAEISTMAQEESSVALTASLASTSSGSTLNDAAAALGMAAGDGNGDYDTYNRNLGLCLGDTSGLGVCDDLSSLAEADDTMNRSLLAAI